MNVRRYMDNLLYRIGELEKAILRGLSRFGRDKSFTQILREAGFTFDNTRQFEAAIGLESLGLIQSVIYKLPLEIRAELSPSGQALVAKDQQSTRRNSIDPNIHTHRGLFGSQPFA